MKLQIQNVAKIKDATIVIDGLTVIAGLNDTGKTTVGKVLFGAVNATHQMSQNVLAQKASEVKKILVHAMPNGVHGAPDIVNREIPFPDWMWSTTPIEKLLSGTLSFEQLEEVTLWNSKTQETVRNRMQEIMDIPESKIQCAVISRYFSRLFSGQINRLSQVSEDAHVALQINQKEMAFTFHDNACTTWADPFEISHRAFYLDDPFVLDKLTDTQRNALPLMQQHLIEAMTQKHAVMDGILGELLAKEKLEQIFAQLQTVVDGSVTEQNGVYGLQQKGFAQPLDLTNLSAGLKSFVILKMLLERNALQEKDVLILDEPEIHLHPQWQMVYAHIIVLLQKTFDLRIVMTTHSMHFLQCIEYYAQKYQLGARAQFYQATVTDGKSQFDNVSQDVSVVYAQLVEPSMQLDSLKFELEDEENDGM